MKCPKCNLIWLSNIPEKNELVDTYEEKFSYSDLYSKKSLRRKIRNSILAGFGYDVEMKTLGKILYLIPLFRFVAGRNIMFIRGEKKGEILDIGCGNGDFLMLMRDLGFDVYGTEINKEAVEYARKRGLNVFHSDLVEAKFPAEFFDVITMNHVIEHLIDPKSVLLECRRILKKDGKLIIATPNTVSISSKIKIGKNWFPLWPPYHTFLFSPHNIKILLNNSGFKVERLDTFSFDPIWLNPKLVDFLSKTKFRKILESRIEKLSPLYLLWNIVSLFGEYNILDEIFVQARKV